MNFDAHNLQFYNLNSKNNDRSELDTSRLSAVCTLALGPCTAPSSVKKIGGVAKSGPERNRILGPKFTNLLAKSAGL
jgi:hypothetical protein